MADIRIKDLATLESASLTGDVFVIDGTTGTRKLSAFSPSFGGNATVTGTLTVNGVATAGSYLTSAAGLSFPGALSASGYYLYSGSANGLTMYGYGSTYDVYIGNRAGTRALSVAANSTVVSIPDSTASTTTSSGALVVSGGVGVGGSINTDGTLRFNANSSLAGTGSIGINGTYGLNLQASTGGSYDFTVFSAAGQSILLVPTGTRNVSFSGTLTTIGNITSGAAITTSAPVGGAGLWELGVYSSTAPSATGYVTIEIGGTVYKLLASNV